MAIAIAATVTAVASAKPAPAVRRDCPALYVIGVQGPDERPAGARPDTDSGMLSHVFAPMLADGKSRIARAYVAYRQPASTHTPAAAATQEGASTAGPGSAAEAAAAATSAGIKETAAQVLADCPDTLLAAAGYAEGARAVRHFARDAGSGSSSIPAARIAAIALIADPDRAPGSPVVPGRDGQLTPSLPPALAGHDQRSRTITFADNRPPGAGVTATRPAPANPGPGPVPPDFGELTGRVVSLCATGDLTCDAPANGTLLQVVHNIVSRANLADPLAAIGAIASGLASTAVNTAVTVINQDVAGRRLPELDYRPQQTISQRLEAASNPANPQPGAADVITALIRLGMIGVDAATTVAKGVLTPDTLAALATAGVANPAAAGVLLGARAAAAGLTLVPPDAPDRLARIAFDTIAGLALNNSDLFDLSVLSKYSGSIGRRQAYNTIPAAPDGTPAARMVANWFLALAHDIDAAPRSGRVTRLPATPGTAEPDGAATVPAAAPEPVQGKPIDSAAPPR